MTREIALSEPARPEPLRRELVGAMLERQHRQSRLGGVGALMAMRAADAIFRLRLGVDGEDAVADGKLALHGQVHQAARRFIRNDLEMIGLALDDAAERDIAVIRRLLILRRNL